MVKTLVAVLVVASVGVARAGDPAQAVDADGSPVQPPGAMQPLPPGATQALPEPDADNDTPMLSAERVLGEAVLGGLFAVGGGLAGGLIGESVATRDGCLGDCGLGGFLVGGAFGLTVAAPVGVYAVGTSGDQTGSFVATLGGSAIGTVVGIALLSAGEGNEATAVLAVSAPVVGAMIGFNATRSWAPVASSAHGTTSFALVGSF